MGVSRLPPRGRGEKEDSSLEVKKTQSALRALPAGEPVASAPLPGGGESMRASCACAGARSPRTPEESSLLQIPGEVLQLPESPESPEPSGQEVSASGSGLRSLGDSGSPEGILAAAEPLEAKEPLWPHWPRGSRTSGFRLQASASEFKLQTSDFKFQLWSSNFKLQTSSFNFQLWSSKFKLQTSSFNFGVQTPDFKFQLWASDSRPQVSALGSGPA